VTEPRPRVSVVTANYNGGRYLAAAIRSVLDQSLSSLELIIVDDRSTDDSLAVIERATAGDQRVRLLVQDENAGPAAARNRALATARGDWVAVFDSDDLMAPERLERLTAAAERDGADIIVDNLLVFSDGAEAAAAPYLPLSAQAAGRWITTADYIAASRLYARAPGLGYLKPLFRAEALGSLRYREDLRIGEDYDLVLRLLLQGARLRLEPEALYRYRKHGGSISHLLRSEHIEQMLAADRDLAEQLARQGPEVRREQGARTRSFERALVYDRVIAALKARQLAPACALALAQPGVWPLLLMPVEARLKRLAKRLKSRTAAAGGPALA
jgi:succinoglycan biosynthesis protein ExoO